MNTLSRTEFPIEPEDDPTLKAPVFARLKPDDPEFEKTCAREFRRIFTGQKVAFDYAGNVFLERKCQAFLDDLCKENGVKTEKVVVHKSRRLPVRVNIVTEEYLAQLPKEERAAYFGEWARFVARF